MMFAKKEKGQEDLSSHEVHVVGHDKATSKTKLRRMMEKEVPYDRIPPEHREAYKEAEEKNGKAGKITIAVNH